jgi:uncharacterized protein YaaQ
MNNESMNNEQMTNYALRITHYACCIVPRIWYNEGVEGNVTTSKAINQLVIATVSGAQAGALTDRLTHDGFQVTQVDSSGGILYEATVSLLIGLNQARLPRLLAHVRECCRTRRRFIPAHVEAPLLEIQPVLIEAEVGGATVYVLDVERFEQL